MLREFLENTSLELSYGVPDVYKDHPTAISIREDGKRILESLLPEYLDDYKVEGSAGRGQWAGIPWVAIYNSSVTDRASQGYYLVYLIPNSTNKIILGLAQSFQEAEKEFGKYSNENLDKQAEIMRMKIPEFQKFFSSSIPEIEISGRLNYRNGHVYHIEYDSTNLPSEEVLVSDLHQMLDAYETLFFRGGRDSDNFFISEQKDEEITIEETFKKKVHYQIERPTSSQIKKIKKKLGYVCEGCEFDFEKVYGELGKEYIEAHHLTPISELKKGESRKITEKDFSVLCANCHRMIHRLDDSSDLEKLKRLIKNAS
jgi:5-methylcytosine-specific restriction enzyme A